MIDEIIKILEQEKQQSLKGYFNSINNDEADPFKHRYFAGRAWAAADIKRKILEWRNERLD